MGVEFGVTAGSFGGIRSSIYSNVGRIIIYEGSKYVRVDVLSAFIPPDGD